MNIEQSAKSATQKKAIGCGMADRSIGVPAMPDKYGANKGSTWEKWYLEGYNNDNQQEGEA